MAHSCNDRSCEVSRRELIKKGALGLTWGLFGLSLPSVLFMKEAQAVQPQGAFYDGILMIYMGGGPSHIDTWDPKRGSVNNVFDNTIRLGVNDIYGKPIEIAPHFTNLSNLVMANPSQYGLGMVRSMTHGNGDHGTATEYMQCFWGTPVAPRYAAQGAVMSYYYKDVATATGLGAVTISGDFADSKGANVPAPLQAGGAAVQQFSLPRKMAGDPDAATRYDKRRQVTDAINTTFAANHPDDTVRAWRDAWSNALSVTSSGRAAQALDLTGKPLVNGDNDLTLAQELLKAGVPYVACGIGGNDTHADNRNSVMSIWTAFDRTISQVAQNLQAAGKKVLIVAGGEFGRTPDSVGHDPAGGRPDTRDGRDHWGDSFSWVMFSVGQSKFKTTAVGDTQKDGMGVPGGMSDGAGGILPDTTLRDPVYPGAFGGLLYRAMGFQVGDSTTFNVPAGDGAIDCPVDRTLATSTNPGGTKWLMQQFGLV